MDEAYRMDERSEDEIGGVRQGVVRVLGAARATLAGGRLAVSNERRFGVMERRLA